jgi:hypothetical protein
VLRQAVSTIFSMQSQHHPWSQRSPQMCRHLVLPSLRVSSRHSLSRQLWTQQFIIPSAPASNSLRQQMHSSPPGMLPTSVTGQNGQALVRTSLGGSYSTLTRIHQNIGHTRSRQYSAQFNSMVFRRSFSGSVSCQHIQDPVVHPPLLVESCTGNDSLLTHINPLHW